MLLCPGISGYSWPDEPELDAEYEARLAGGDEDSLVDLCVRIWGAAGPDPFVADLARSAVARVQPATDSSTLIRLPSIVSVRSARRQ